MTKVILEREKCIGCGSCQAVCPDHFEMQDDGKSRLLGSKQNKQDKTEELETEELACMKDAAEACPIQIIKIV